MALKRQDVKWHDNRANAPHNADCRITPRPASQVCALFFYTPCGRRIIRIVFWTPDGVLRRWSIRIAFINLRINSTTVCKGHKADGYLAGKMAIWNPENTLKHTDNRSAPSLSRSQNTSWRLGFILWSVTWFIEGHVLDVILKECWIRNHWERASVAPMEADYKWSASSANRRECDRYHAWNWPLVIGC